MEHRVEILVFAGEATGAAPLVEGLEAQGYGVDLVTSVQQAQGIFLERGGHALLVVSPDVGTGQALQVIEKLRSVDDGLPIILFGDDVLRDTKLLNVHRIRSFHPGSRAGIGAIQKVICNLSPS